MSAETWMPDKSRHAVTIAAFSATGLVSGVLTACSLTYLSALGPLIGSIFGAAMAICLSLRQRTWSGLRIISLIASAMMAHFAAVWSPIGLLYVQRLLHIESGQGDSNDFSPEKFAMAGFVGAFVFILAVLFLFYQEKGSRVPAKAAALALPGALLGLLSAFASNAIQEVVAQWITPSTSWVFKPEQLYSAYLIWQTGMALVLAALLPQNATLPLNAQGDFITPSQTSLSIGGKIFVAFMLAAAFFLGLMEIHDSYRAAYQQRQVAKSRRDAPSTQNLPEIKSQPIQQALILNEIAGYAESGAEVSRVPAQREYKGTDSGYLSSAAVVRMLYSVHYQKAGIASGVAQGVTVQVWEYPNAEWAKYQLRNTPFAAATALIPEKIKTVKKFGNSVLENGEGINSQYIYWSSANRLIVLHYSGQTDEEFVRQYLSRYPSSL
jgi:hypothetical protein